MRPDGYSIEFLPNAHQKPGKEVGPEFDAGPEDKRKLTDDELYRASG